MKKKDLLRLDILSSRTPNEIKKEAPELFSTLATRTGLTRKAVLEKKLADASAEIKKELSKIDRSSDRLGNRDPKEILKERILKEGKSRKVGKECRSRWGEEYDRRKTSIIM